MYILVAAVIICAVLTVVLSRIYVKRAFDSIDALLDHVLARDAAMLPEITGEDRISKLSHKARRILEMYVSEAARVRDEKETIQGFISDMSHQMKTPLSGISMHTDLLLEGAYEREFLLRIKSGAEKLRWMMDSLIKMSRLEAGAIELSPAREDIKRTLSEAVAEVIPVAMKKDINIEVEEFGDIFVFHDRRWTREAISNVLENAVKYSHERTTIKVSIEPLPMFTKIMITDCGIGIQKEDYNLIFRRFYRGGNAKNAEGAGLGLYIAGLIMEKQGGYIMVDSTPGTHTTFSLFLQNCKK